ncbi:transglutaminase-like domain-containing protein [Saltatorellus ferox]
MQASRTRSAGWRFRLALLLAGWVLSSYALAGGNLVSNPGFERGGKEIDGWERNVPISVATVKPKFTVNEVEPAEGKRSASVRADYQGGLTAYTQVLRVPPRGKSMHFEAQVRLDRIAYEGGAKLKLSFVGPELPGGRVESESRLLTGVSDWTLLAIDASIPEGTKSIEVRCGVVGPCVASFDEVVVTASDEDSLDTVFGTVHSDYTVRLPANAVEQMLEPFVRLPLPLVSDTQRPIALRINSRPEERVSTLRIFRQGANRMLEIHFHPMFPGDEIKFRLETLVMIDAALRLPSGMVRLPRPAQIHGDEAIYLEPAPGIDPANEAIVEALREMKGNDLPDVLEKVHAWVGSKIQLRRSPSDEDARMPEPSEPDESVAACLATGEAGPVGFANALASVLRGYGLPARLMIGTSHDGQADEHYYVDVWTPSLGWTRMDPLTGRWPVAATEAVIHRQVDPLDARPNGHTPYDPKVGSVGLILEARPDRLNRARLYRYAAPVPVMESGLTALRTRVDTAYDDLVGDPLSKDEWTPIPGIDATLPQIPGASRAHLEIQRWLNAPRLVGQ